MTGVLFARQLRRHLALLLAVLAGVAVFEVLVVVVIAAMDAGAGLQTVVGFLPPPMRRMVFEQFGVASFPGAVAFGFQHPLSMVAAVALLVTVATVPAGERETGLLDLLLARPVPRTRYLAASLAMVVLAAVLVPVALLASAAVGLRLVEGSGELPWTSYAPSAAALAPLLLVVGCYSLLAATLARRRGTAVAAAVGATLFLYWLDFMAGFWDVLDEARWLSPFTYYDPVRAAVGAGLGLRDPLLLLGAAAALTAAAFVSFQRQEL